MQDLLWPYEYIRKLHGLPWSSWKCPVWSSVDFGDPYFGSWSVYFQVALPKVTGIYQPRPIGKTLFWKFYERGDFPIGLEHGAKGNRIAWKVRAIDQSSWGPSQMSCLDYDDLTWTGLTLCSRQIPLDKIDYHHYLPLFFEGLRETTHPYEFFAKQGTHDLLEHGGPLVLPVVPQLIMPLKRRYGWPLHVIVW